MNFLKIKDTGDNLAFVYVIYADIEVNERFKKPGMPMIGELPDPPDSEKTYLPYYDKATGELVWVAVDEEATV